MLKIIDTVFTNLREQLNQLKSASLCEFGGAVPVRTTLSLVFLMFSSVFTCAQTITATCTNWKFFNAFTPSGINIWDTVVGSAVQSDNSIAGYVRYSNGATKKYVDPNATRPRIGHISPSAMPLG